MSVNRRRRLENTVPVGAYSPWLIIAILALVGGMTWVYYKNQIIKRGETIKDLENQVAAVEQQNRALKVRIATLSGCTELQKRVNEGFVKMVKISQASVVHIDFPRSSVANGSDLRTVSNEIVRR